MFCWAGATVVGTTVVGALAGAVVGVTVVVVVATVVVVVVGVTVVVVVATVVVVVVGLVVGPGAIVVFGVGSAGSCSTPAKAVVAADRPSSAVAATMPTRVSRECRGAEG
jgi:hypothetical protein